MRRETAFSFSSRIGTGAFFNSSEEEKKEHVFLYPREFSLTIEFYITYYILSFLRLARAANSRVGGQGGSTLISIVGE